MQSKKPQVFFQAEERGGAALRKYAGREGEQPPQLSGRQKAQQVADKIVRAIALRGSWNALVIALDARRALEEDAGARFGKHSGIAARITEVPQNDGSCAYSSCARKYEVLVNSAKGLPPASLSVSMDSEGRITISTRTDAGVESGPLPAQKMGGKAAQKELEDLKSHLASFLGGGYHYPQ